MQTNATVTGGTKRMGVTCATARQFSRNLNRLLRFGQLFFLNRVATQQWRQILRKRRAWHHHIASRFQGLHLQLALHVRDKADDVGLLLQLVLELRNHGERLATQSVQVDDDERRLIVAVLPHALEDVFVGLYELDLDVKLSRGLLDLGEEEQVINKRIDARGSITGDRQRFKIYRTQLPAESLIVAAAFGFVEIAVRLAEHRAIAMVHRRRVNSAQGFHLAGTSTGLASRVLLAKTTPALVFLLALVLAVLVTLAMRLALSLVVLLAWLLGCSVRSRSAAAAPPSASLPSRITGRRIRSLIHIALYVVSFSRGSRDSHFYTPHLLAAFPHPDPRNARLRLES